MSGHTPWRQLKTDTNELGPRAARAIQAETRAAQSQNAPDMLSLLLAKRVRAYNLREGVKNNDAHDVPAVPIPQREVDPAGPARFNRFAGGSQL